MSITFTKEITDGANAELFGNVGSRAVRVFRAEGLPTDTTTLQPEEVMFGVAEAAKTTVGGMGAAYPGRSNLFLSRIQTYGIPTSGQYAMVKLIYEPFGGIGMSTIIDIGGSLGSYTTNMMPDTGEPLSIRYDPDDTGDLVLEKIPDDYTSVTILRATRRIGVTQLITGTLTEDEASDFADNIELVNQSTWRGRPPGSWIISNANASISKYGGYYQRRIEALAIGRDVWSYFGITRSNKTNKAAGTETEIVAARAALKAADYSPVTRRVATRGSGGATVVMKRTDSGYAAAKQQGVIRVDPYHWTEFEPLFGF